MDLSEIIGALVLGLIAGFVARALLPGKQSMSLVMTILLGLVGSFVGYLIFAELLGIGDDDAFDLGGLIGAIIGAMLVLFLYERFAGGGAVKRPHRAEGGGAGREPDPRRRRGGRDR